MIVTIDGPAGAGKSTVAKALARELGWTYLDSGAIYRAITLKALRERVDLNDADALRRIAETIDLDLDPRPDGLRVRLDGEDVTDAIRAPEVSRHAHHAASCAEVRKAILPLQRRFAERGDLVAEGRDMGTVVFPDAEFKCYLDARPKERAARRHRELKAKGVDAALEDVLQEILTRDERDRNRAAAPLRKPDDAVVLDTTDMSVEDVTEKLRGMVLARRQAAWKK